MIANSITMFQPRAFVPGRAMQRGAVIVLLVASIAQSTCAQSLRLQSEVLSNDKLQKEYLPYKVAIQKTLGHEFLEAHRPVIERRRVCEWDGTWSDCGYLSLGGTLLTATERQLVVATLMDPCKNIDISSAATLYRFTPKDAGREAKLAGKFAHLESLCHKGFLNGTAVRSPAVYRWPHDGRGGSKPVTEFEVLIKLSSPERK